MNYWMVVLSPQNFKIEADSLGFKLLGLPKRYRESVKLIAKGDKILFYINTISCVGAVAEAAGDYFCDPNEKIWMHQHEVYPWRMPIKPLIVLDECDLLEVKHLIKDLGFVKNKDRWMIYFQGSFRKIPKEDFLLIEKRMSDVI